MDFTTTGIRSSDNDLAAAFAIIDQTAPLFDLSDAGGDAVSKTVKFTRDRRTQSQPRLTLTPLEVGVPFPIDAIFPESVGNETTTEASELATLEEFATDVAIVSQRPRLQTAALICGKQPRASRSTTTDFLQPKSMISDRTNPNNPSIPLHPRSAVFTTSKKSSRLQALPAVQSRANSPAQQSRPKKHERTTSRQRTS